MASWPYFLSNCPMLYLFGGAWQRRRTAIPAATRRMQCYRIVRLHDDFARVGDGFAIDQETACHSRSSAVESFRSQVGPAGDGIEQPLALCPHIEGDDLSVAAPGRSLSAGAAMQFLAAEQNRHRSFQNLDGHRGHPGRIARRTRSILGAARSHATRIVEHRTG